MSDRLAIVPCALREANAFVRRHHRHHQPARGCRFCIAAAIGEVVVGVAIVSRPVARLIQDGWTVEVVRCCTDGTRNACSKLYAASWKAAQALGYKRLVTYTLPEEGGASLRALDGLGFRCIGHAGGGTWDRKDRPRVDEHPTQGKFRWEVEVTT